MKGDFGVLLLCAAAAAAVHGLDNGLGKTPPMGWMSWERFRCNIDCKTDPDNCFTEKLIKQHIDILGTDEWHGLGYEYVNLDDCWANWNRTEDGKLAGNNSRFPSVKHLADYAHAAGLSFGIYEDMGTNTCGGYPGECKDESCTLPGYMSVDADTFAEWGIDSLKMDGCNSIHTKEVLDPGYEFMGTAMNKTGRPMLYSCSWPDYIRTAGLAVNYTQTAEHCNIWRMYNDIQDSWDSVTGIVDWVGDNQEDLIPAAGPGHFNDPDMLIIGNFALSHTQARAQFALWSIMAAPLLMGNDLRNLEPEMKAVLQSKEVIAVDQDVLGIQGRRLEHNSSGPPQHSNGYTLGDVWSKPLSNGDLAVALWNRCDYGDHRVMSANWTLLGLPAGQKMNVRDLYKEEDIGVFSDSFSQYVDIWDVAMLRLSPA